MNRRTKSLAPDDKQEPSTSKSQRAVLCKTDAPVEISLPANMAHKPAPKSNDSSKKYVARIIQPMCPIRPRSRNNSALTVGVAQQFSSTTVVNAETKDKATTIHKPLSKSKIPDETYLNSKYLTSEDLTTMEVPVETLVSDNNEIQTIHVGNFSNIRSSHDVDCTTEETFIASTDSSGICHVTVQKSNVDKTKGNNVYTPLIPAPVITPLPTSRGSCSTKRGIIMYGKSRMIADTHTNICVKEYKAQLTDTSDTIGQMEIAPPTKFFMQTLNTKGVNKLFATPADQSKLNPVSRKRCYPQAKESPKKPASKRLPPEAKLPQGLEKDDQSKIKPVSQKRYLPQAKERQKKPASKRLPPKAKLPQGLEKEMLSDDHMVVVETTADISAGDAHNLAEQSKIQRMSRKRCHPQDKECQKKPASKRLPPEAKLPRGLEKANQSKRCQPEAREGQQERVTDHLASEAEPETKPDAEPVAEPETKPDAEPQTEPEAKERQKKPASEHLAPKAEPETKPDAEPETKPDAEPVAEPETKPDAEPETEPEAKEGQKKPAREHLAPEAEPETKPDAEPETEPEAKEGQQKPASEHPAPEAEPGTKPDAKEGQLEPASEHLAPEAEPGTKPDAKEGQQKPANANPEPELIQDLDKVDQSKTTQISRQRSNPEAETFQQKPANSCLPPEPKFFQYLEKGMQTDDHIHEDHSGTDFSERDVDEVDDFILVDDSSMDGSEGDVHEVEMHTDDFILIEDSSSDGSEEDVQEVGLGSSKQSNTDTRARAVFPDKRGIDGRPFENALRAKSGRRAVVCPSPVHASEMLTDDFILIDDSSMDSSVEEVEVPPKEVIIIDDSSDSSGSSDSSRTYGSYGSYGSNGDDTAGDGEEVVMPLRREEERETNQPTLMVHDGQNSNMEDLPMTSGKALSVAAEKHGTPGNRIRNKGFFRPDLPQSPDQDSECDDL